MKFCRTFFLLSWLFFYVFNAHAQSVVWAENPTNGIGGAYSNSMTIDANGNFLISGGYWHATDFDPGPGTFILNPAAVGGGWDPFVLKLDSNRNFIWAEGFGSTAFNEFGRKVEVDAADNVYVSGGFSGTVDFDPGPAVYNLTAPFQTGVFVQKLSPAGTLLWAKVVPGNNSNQRYSLVVDPGGYVFVAGEFRFTGDFDPGVGVVNLTAANSLANAFILKLDAAGDFVWVKQIQGSGHSYTRAIKLDAANNIYVTGDHTATNDFDPGPGFFHLTSSGLGDAYVLKLNSAGNFVWVKGIQGPNDDEVSAMTVSSAGVVTLAGFSFGGTDFDPGPSTLSLPYMNNADCFVERLDSAGNLIWAKAMGGMGRDQVDDLRVDATGGVYLIGHFQEVADFDPSPNNLLLSSGSSNFAIFFQKLDPMGNLVFAKRLHNNYDLYGSTIELDQNLNIYISAWVGGNIDCDPGPGSLIVSFDPSDMLLAKYRQDSCFTLALSVDSIRSITCQNPLGFAAVGVFGATGAATVTWNTTPATTGLSANFTTAGIYTALVTDTRGCAAEASVVITAPNSSTGFDVATEIIPSDFRPGFSSTFQVQAFNNSCTPATGQVKLTLDTMLVFTSALPAPTSVIGDTLIWNFSNLAYGGATLTPAVTVMTPLWAVSGDTICLNTKVLPIVGDVDTTNNRASTCVLVTSSFDPNDKQVDPPGQCDEHFVFRGTPLTYKVRFQNTGTATATNVRVVDGLDFNFDLSSFRIVAQSHPMVTQILPGNILEFSFENIQLPDSFANEPASHGFVVYEITPSVGILAGTEIRNRAGIYFDFNAPVYTEQTYSNIIDTLPIDYYGDTVFVCQGGSFTFSDGTTVTNVSSDLSHTVNTTSPDGCPAATVTQLYMMTVDTGVVATATNLTALGFAFSYTWLDCNNNFAPIPGATSASFTPTLTGNYAVEIYNGCFDTSSCYFIAAGNLTYYYDTTSVCVGDDFTFHDGFVATNVVASTSHTSHFAVSGGDSAIVTNLVVTTVDTSVTVSGGTLTAHATAATFQWLDCDSNYYAIPNAIDSVYQTMSSGFWAVEVTQNGCVDTSNCFEFIYISVGDPQASGYLHILPNPTNGQLRLRSNRALKQIEVTNLLGISVFRMAANRNLEVDLDLGTLPKGIYFLKAGDGLEVKRLIIE